MVPQPITELRRRQLEQGFSQPMTKAVIPGNAEAVQAEYDQILKEQRGRNVLRPASPKHRPSR